MTMLLTLRVEHIPRDSTPEQLLKIRLLILAAVKLAQTPHSSLDDLAITLWSSKIED